MAQLLSNEDEVLEAYDPSIAASRRFRYVRIRLQIPMELISKSFFFRHPIAVFFHMAFRSLAIVAYFVCSWVKASFVTSFVIIIILLSMDFWTVKNITGRLLAGLRYWNYVDDAGNNHWIFESRKVRSNHSSKVPIRLFHLFRVRIRISSHQLKPICSGCR